MLDRKEWLILLLILVDSDINVATNTVDRNLVNSILVDIDIA